MIILCLTLGTVCLAGPASEIDGSLDKATGPSLDARFGDIEREQGCDIHLAAFDAQDGRLVTYRAGERLAFCSTFKFFLVAEILRLADRDRNVLAQRLFWQAADELSWSPATRGRGERGMSVLALCEAAMALSDNTAANALLRLLGGPKAMTRVLRSLGDRDFLLCDYEPDLNHTGTEFAGTEKEAGQDRPPHANTGSAMGFLQALRALFVSPGSTFPEFSRAQLLRLARARDKKRIASVLPEGAEFFRKTGTGYGNVHDMGLVRCQDGRQCLLVIFTKASGRREGSVSVPAQERAIACAAHLVFETFGL